MVGAYMSWFVMNQLGLGPVTAVCATIITCTLLGVVIEKIAYTPLRSAPRISLLITAIGVSFFLEYTAELILGSGAKVIPLRINGNLGDQPQPLARGNGNRPLVGVDLPGHDAEDRGLARAVAAQ